MTPEGWTETKMKAAFSSRREKGEAGLPVLSVTLRDGLKRRDELDRKMDSELAPEGHLRIRKGDIAYNMMRMWQGASGQAEYDGMVSPAYVVLAPTAAVDSDFMAYLLKHDRTIYDLWAYSYGLTSDRLRLYFNDFCNVPLSLPPLAEQKKIAKILSNWDQAIETTEKLVANAEAQKKALMQQLLTGQKRLPGFEGQWENQFLRDVANIFAGGTPTTSKSEYWGGDINWMSSGEINLRQVTAVEGRITSEGLKNSSARMVPVNSVLIALAGQGKTRGKVAINKIELCTNQSVAAINPSDRIDAEYLFHNLDSRYQEIRAMSLGDGGRGGLNLQVIGSIRIPLPSIEEQKGIARVLEAGEADLNGLVEQARKLRLEKSALMQQLLTGKRRVKLDGGV